MPYDDDDDDDDDDDVIHLLCGQRNLYAMQKNVQLDLTESELFVIIIGGLFLSGYAKYPNKWMYWSKESDGPIILSDSIRCNRFETILRYLYLNDNALHDGSDRFFKLSPLLTLLPR